MENQAERLDGVLKPRDEVQNMALTLFGRECGLLAATMMEEVGNETDTSSADPNNVEHLMGALIKIEQDHTMKEEDKNVKMREVVGHLKKHEQSSFNEAWHHHNEMF